MTFRQKIKFQKYKYLLLVGHDQWQIQEWRGRDERPPPPLTKSNLFYAAFGKNGEK